MSASGVRITDAAGQSFNIQGCSTVGQLKDSILEHTGIPTDKQKISRTGAKEIELTDADTINSDEEMQLLIDGVNGGCEVKGFFIKIQGFECKFRCSVCYNGIDCEWNKCQYCCVHAGCTIL